jgi:hypothetical protein
LKSLDFLANLTSKKETGDGWGQEQTFYSLVQ